MSEPQTNKVSASGASVLDLFEVGCPDSSTSMPSGVPCNYGRGPGDDPEKESQAQSWAAADVAKDVALLSTGTIFAAAANLALLFLIPRILTVEEYGYWRLFVLYAGYVGLLHLGFPDGALVRWAGRDFSDFHQELRPSIRFVFLQQLVFAVPLGLIFAFGLSSQLRFIAIAIALLAVVTNLVTLLQYAFQAGRCFRPVALSTMSGPAFFLCLVLFWSKGLRQSLDSQRLILMYSLAWLVTLGFLLVKARAWAGARRNAARFAKRCISTGWPIVLANTVAGLTLNVDRLSLSWAANIRNFAQYSLAASAMAVPIMAIQASSKVLFPHLAGLPPENRMRFYGVASRSLLIAWALLMPYYFVLDVFVHHVLPKYVPSLEIARILLLGIVFIAGIQVLQAAFAYLNGKQVQYLLATTVMLGLGCAGAYWVVFRYRSLELLAALQVVVLVIWWLLNEWSLRDLTLQRMRDWVKFLSLFGSVSLIYFLAAKVGRGAVTSALIYYACIAVFLALFCRNDLGMWCRMLKIRVPALGRLPGGEGLA